MSTEENKALVRRIYEVINSGNLDALDAYHAPDIAGRGLTGNPTANVSVSGQEAARRYLSRIRATYPDVHFTIEDLIAEGDKVVVRWVQRGTQQGEARVRGFAVAPSGKQIAVAGITIYRISDGKLAEVWQLTDNLGLLQQVGAIPASGQGGG